MCSPWYPLSSWPADRFADLDPTQEYSKAQLAHYAPDPEKHKRFLPRLSRKERGSYALPEVEEEFLEEVGITGRVGVGCVREHLVCWRRGVLWKGACSKSMHNGLLPLRPPPRCPRSRSWPGPSVPPDPVKCAALQPERRRSRDLRDAIR